jgi:hypothetical protein
MFDRSCEGLICYTLSNAIFDRLWYKKYSVIGLENIAINDIYLLTIIKALKKAENWMDISKEKQIYYRYKYIKNTGVWISSKKRSRTKYIYDAKNDKSYEEIITYAYIELFFNEIKISEGNTRHIDEFILYLESYYHSLKKDMDKKLKKLNKDRNKEYKRKIERDKLKKERDKVNKEKIQKYLN